jgi:hypothetical protein
MSTLENHGRKLETIEGAIAAIAVQDEQIQSLQTQMTALFAKLEVVLGPEGTIVHMKEHQASCPKSQVKWLWTAIAAQALMIIGKFLTG